MRCFIGLLGILSAANCSAANIAFLPGDAFFHARLTDEVAERSEAGEPLSFGYSRPVDDAGAFCGFAGFWRLEITGDTQGLSRELKWLFGHLRKSFPPERTLVVGEGDDRGEVDIRGYHLFVYARSYDTDRFGVASKYNEDWPDLPAEAVQEQGGFRLAVSGLYRPFVRTYEFAVNDWRHARSVAGLPVIVPPDISWGVAQARIEQPVAIDADDIMLLVLPQEDLTGYVNREPDLPFYRLTTEGVSEVEWVEGRMVERE